MRGSARVMRERIDAVYPSPFYMSVNNKLSPGHITVGGVAYQHATVVFAQLKKTLDNTGHDDERAENRHKRAWAVDLERADLITLTGVG